MGPWSLMQWAIIMGKDMPEHLRWCCAMSCAKMAEPIDFPSVMWTQVGRRKHKFKRIRQVAPVCTSSVVIVIVVFARLRKRALMREHIGATWRIRLNRPSAAAMRPYVKLLWPLVPFCRIANLEIFVFFVTRTNFIFTTWSNCYVTTCSPKVQMERSLSL